MHLIIDGQALQTPSSRQRGIGRYSINLLRTLAKVRPEWRMEVVGNTALRPLTSDVTAGLPVIDFPPPLSATAAHREINERYYADWLTARGPNAVLILSYCEGWDAVVPSFCGPRPRVYGIAYDLIPLLYPKHYLQSTEVCRWYAHRFRQLLDADALLAISAATARDIRILAGENGPHVVNITGAVDPLFAPLSSFVLVHYERQLRKRYGLHREFLLYVGATDYRKNLMGALRAFAALPAEYRQNLDLAIVARATPTEQQTIRGSARELGIDTALKLITSANDEELRALYQMCRLFFFPSLYEGLGLPVLEALHCGAPVVTSDRSSLPEYAGPVSWLGDPESAEEMARVTVAALAEPRDQRRKERQAFAKSFSWEKSAAEACAIMTTDRTRLRKRRRLAWVSPLLPQALGMAEYAADLLGPLSQYFQIDLVVEGSHPKVPGGLAKDHLVLTAEELPSRHAVRPYDLILYHLADSPLHHYVSELMQSYRGLAVLHDVPKATAPVRWGGGKLDKKGRKNHLPFTAHHRLPCDPHHLRRAAAVLTHSVWQWRRVRDLLEIPSLHLPQPLVLPELSSPADERQHLRLPSDAFVVVVLAEEKDCADRLAPVLRALARQGADMRSRMLLVVLSEGEGKESSAVALAANEGLAEVLWRTGTPPSLLPYYARAADVWVQLSPLKDGESTTLMRILAAGTACIVSAEGNGELLPDNIVWKINADAEGGGELEAALSSLHQDAALRRTLAETAAQYVARRHSLHLVVEHYRSWIDLLIQKQEHADGHWLSLIAQCLTANLPRKTAESLIDNWTKLRAQGQSCLGAEGSIGLSIPLQRCAA